MTNGTTAEYRIVFEAAHEYETYHGAPLYRAHRAIMPDRWHAQVKRTRRGIFGGVKAWWERIATTRDAENHLSILEARIEDHRQGRLLVADGSRIVATYVEKPTTDASKATAATG